MHKKKQVWKLKLLPITSEQGAWSEKNADEASGFSPNAGQQETN